MKSHHDLISSSNRCSKRRVWDRSRESALLVPVMHGVLQNGSGVLPSRHGPAVSG